MLTPDNPFYPQARLLVGEFLLSFKRGEPRWELLGVAHAPNLPAVRWKLHNLDRMGAARRRQAVADLEHALADF